MNIESYELKYISYSYYERGMRNSLYDPIGIGREKADDIVHFSETKKDIRKALKRVMLESKQPYFSLQVKMYYKSLINELKDYERRSEDYLSLYRRRY